MMATKRLIDPERYETTLQRFAEHLTEFGKLEAAEAVRSLIKGLKIAPTVDAVEVVHGEWSIIEDDYTGLVGLECSVCEITWWFEEEYSFDKYHYCPGCGARMDGEGKL